MFLKSKNPKIKVVLADPQVKYCVEYNTTVISQCQLLCELKLTSVAKCLIHKNGIYYSLELKL